MLEYPDEVRKIMTLIGFNANTPPYHINLKGKLFIFLSFYMYSQTIKFMIIFWTDLPKRFHSIEHSVVSLVITLVMLEYTFFPKSVHKLLALAESEHFEYRSLFLRDYKQRLVERTHKDINFAARCIYILLTAEMLSFTLFPVLSIIFNWLFNQNELENIFEISNLPLPFTTTHKCTNTLSYLTLYAIQSIYIWCGALIAYCVNNSISFATYSVATEVMLMIVALRHMDEKFNAGNTGNVKLCDIINNNDIVEEPTLLSEGQLRSAFKQIVMHHKSILRKYELLNANANITIIMLNNILTFLICLTIYSFVKASDTISKCKYLVQLLPITALLYMYSLKGQDLINEGERLEQTIAELNWVGKPRWFKSSLLLMLLKCKKRLEVKPFSIYVVDLQNFALVMNAAYSYFNIFNRIS